MNSAREKTEGCRRPFPPVSPASDQNRHGVNLHQSRKNRKLFPSPLRRESLTNQCQNPPGSDRLPESVQSVLLLIEQLSGLNKTIALFMLSSGCRINEVLNIRYRDIRKTGHVCIRASKRSRSRVVFYPQFSTFAENALRNPNGGPFQFHTYKKFYRAFKQLLPGDSPHSAIRQKVSNLLRCAAADLAQSLSNGDTSVPPEFLGHKSPRSTTFYLTERK
jgi:integrase